MQKASILFWAVVAATAIGTTMAHAAILIDSI